MLRLSRGHPTATPTGQTTSPPQYYNFATIPTVYHGAYEYSVPHLDQDFLPQTEALPASALSVEEATHHSIMTSD